MGQSVHVFCAFLCAYLCATMDDFRCILGMCLYELECMCLCAFFRIKNLFITNQFKLYIKNVMLWEFNLYLTSRA